MQGDFFNAIIYILVGIYGLLIGSFLNVCIYRIPRGEGIVKGRSHCMNCEKQIAWYDLIPVVSWLCLGARCRSCKTKISYQYPLMEAANALIYLWIVYKHGVTVNALFYALTASALLALSVIDWRTFEIPIHFTAWILLLGAIHLTTDLAHWHSYVIGFFSISTFLLIVFALTKGQGIGGGDIKLMAVIGLLLGWKLTLLAFMLGCILGAIIHSLRMKFLNEESRLAFGPYLATGILVAMLYGNEIIEWYMRTFFYI